MINTLSFAGRTVVAPSSLALKCIALALTLIASVAQTEPKQLYAIARGPLDVLGSSGWVVLYRVEGDGLAKVRTITTSFQSSLFVRPYPDDGLVLVGSEGATGIHVDIIDLSRVSYQKSFNIDASSHGSLLKMGDRLVYVNSGDREGRFWRQGIDLGTGDRLEGPSGKDPAPVRSSTGDYINNDHISVRVIQRQGATRLRVTRKADEASVEIEWPGRAAELRGFHQWVVADETNDSKEQTGRMVFYHAGTGRWIIHDTGEPDCEVLLIDGNDVAYYRLNDELWRGDIMDEQLANTERIAKAPEMLYVHWMVEGSW